MNTSASLVNCAVCRTALWEKDTRQGYGSHRGWDPFSKFSLPYGVSSLGSRAHGAQSSRPGGPRREQVGDGVKALGDVRAPAFQCVLEPRACLLAALRREEQRAGTT